MTPDAAAIGTSIQKGRGDTNELATKTPANATPTNTATHTTKEAAYFSATTKRMRR